MRLHDHATAEAKTPMLHILSHIMTEMGVVAADKVVAERGSKNMGMVVASSRAKHKYTSS